MPPTAIAFPLRTVTVIEFAGIVVGVAIRGGPFHSTIEVRFDELRRDFWHDCIAVTPQERCSSV